MPASSEIRCAGQCDHSAAKTVAFAIAHAVLFAAAFPPLGAWPLIAVAPAPLAWLAINAASTRRALLVVLATQVVMWLWLDRWLIGVTLAGYPAKALYMALYPLLFTWLVRRVARSGRLAPLPMSLVVAVAWTACEGLRGELVFDGYPWFLLAHPLVEWPLLAQSADLLGTYFVSFVAALAAGALVDVVRWHARQVRPRTAIASAATVVVLLGINGAYGAWRLGQRDALAPGPRILAIQTNLPQNNKVAWTIAEQREDVASFIALTREAFAATGGAWDLIAWPETMLPVHGLEAETLEMARRWGQGHEVEFARGVAGLRDDLDTALLIGSPCFIGLDVDQSGAKPRFVWERNHNSAYLVAPGGGLQRYDKVQLTPFGEIMPYISAWPWLEERLLWIGAPGMSFSLDAADTIERLDLVTRDGRTVRLATPICFEDVLPGVCRRMVYADGAKQVDVLVNLSNDGWFGTFDSGRIQHAQAARLRCIENRVPMVRCVNTGLSVAIDSAGNLAGRVGDDRYGDGRRSGWMEADVLVDGRTTVYSRVGDVWPWICIALAAGLGVATAGGGRSGQAGSDSERQE
jgi:apolipoprotein N-acyltransferase